MVVKVNNYDPLKSVYRCIALGCRALFTVENEKTESTTNDADTLMCSRFSLFWDFVQRYEELRPPPDEIFELNKKYCEIDNENNILMTYHGTSSIVTIPRGVTSIAGHCFKDNRNIKVIWIPASVKRIGDAHENLNGAFFLCDKLEKVYFEEESTLEEIGNWAFYGCTNLQDVLRLPNKLVHVKSCAFSGCVALNKLTLRHIQYNTLNLARDWSAKTL